VQICGALAAEEQRWNAAGHEGPAAGTANRRAWPHVGEGQPYRRQEVDCEVDGQQEYD
jgi:hypothetical protein